MSLIKLIKQQLGLSVTPANNFVLDASADNGTMKLSRGNAGATTQDILTVDASGRVNPNNGLSNALVPVDTGVVGYSTGSGGTVTQETSKSTAVTLNKPTGQITMNGAALAAGASVIFGLNTPIATLSDTCVVTATNNFGASYRVEAYMAVTGTVGIRITNVTGGSLSQAVVINFAIIKGATI